VSGWKKISSKWYHFDTKGGWMDVGVTEIGGKKYFLGSDGVLASKAGWQKVVNEDYTEWYYTDSDGVCKTGWQKIGGNWYYFEPDFAYMCTGYWNIGGEDYYFDDNGVWIKNPG
ncbi:MAG: cell wall-binding protein, partial [Lachnospiraceae bacterium]|nr:cell wall-binding protein [Lachnospiraceae bacterium]